MTSIIMEKNQLTAENRKLKQQLKQQYKRAKTAEEVGEQWQIKAGEFEDHLEASLNAHKRTEQIGFRLFTMLEHALESKAKGI